MTKFIKIVDTNGNLIVLNISSISAIFPNHNYNGLAGSLIYFSNGLNPIITQETPESLFSKIEAK